MTPHAGSEQEDDLARRVDRIEAAYEFMLAYAAQGRDRDDGSAAGGIRQFLGDLARALDGLPGACAVRVAVRPEAFTPFIDVIAADAAKALAAVQMVLAQPGIGSQLVDNLNASIHLRALLTDLFLIDEASKGRQS
jgi:hypothetical protein